MSEAFQGCVACLCSSRSAAPTVWLLVQAPADICMTTFHVHTDNVYSHAVHTPAASARPPIALEDIYSATTTSRSSRSSPNSTRLPRNSTQKCRPRRAPLRAPRNDVDDPHTFAVVRYIASHRILYARSSCHHRRHLRACFDCSVYRHPPCAPGYRISEAQRPHASRWIFQS